MRQKLVKLGRFIPITIVTVVIGAVCLSYYRSTQTDSKLKVQVGPSLSEEITDLTEGFTVFHSEQGQTTIEVNAKVRLGLKGKKSRLEVVSAKILGKKGSRYDTITSQRCEVDHVSGNILFSGNVVITLGVPKEKDLHSTTIDPSIIKAESMRYSQKSGQVLTDAPVIFKKGRIHGSSVGLIYDSHSEHIYLPADVDVVVLSRFEGSSSLEFKADSLQYYKQSGVVELQSNVWVKKGSSELTADQMRVFCTLVDSGLSRIEAAGNVRSKSLDPGMMLQLEADRLSYWFAQKPGSPDRVVALGDVVAQPLKSRSLQQISAQEMTLIFSAQSQAIESLIARREVRGWFLSFGESGRSASLRITDGNGITEKSPGSRILTSSHLQVYFKIGTSQLLRVEADGSSTLEEFPYQPGEDKRTLSGRNFILFYREHSDQLERFTAEHEVKVRFVPVSGPVRETTSDYLEALFDKGTNQVFQLRQTGNFTYHELDRRATAQEAIHLVNKSITRLEGRPEASDDQSKMEANIIEFDRDHKLVKAQGNVRSIYYGSKTNPKAWSNSVYASAELMEFQTQTGIGHYWRNAKLWQEDHALYAESIFLDRFSRKLIASGEVTSLFHSSFGEEGETSTMVKAKRMTYEEEPPKVLYEDGVRTTTSQGSLKCDRLQIFLKRQQGEISVRRILAEGHVRMTQLNRSSFSQMAEYLSLEKKVMLWGGSPQIVDYERGSTTGARLTININDDSVSVEGNPEKQAVSKQRLSR